MSLCSHGVQVRRQKRITVLPMIQRHGSTGSEKDRVRHAEEAKDGLGKAVERL